MKKFLSFAVCALFVLVFTGISFAQSGNRDEVAERFSLGAEVAYYAYGDEHNEAEVQGAPMVKIVGEYALSDNFATNFKIGYTNTDLEDPEDGIGLMEMDIIPLELNLQYQIPLMDNQLIPYIGGGVVYNIIEGSPHDDIKNDVPSFATVSMDADNCWGGQLFVGVDYIPMDNLTLGLETGYSWAKTEVDYVIDVSPYYYESGTEEISLNSWTIAANVAYRF